MAFDPHKITRQHVLQAIAKIKAEQIELQPSTRWDVLFDNVRYPPKDVLRYAHQEMNGEFLWHYSGGDSTNNYLKKLGFEVVEKINGADPIQQLIHKYKEDIRLNKLANEVYKWKLLKQFQGRPNLNVADFLEEVKSINYSNLIYPVGIGVIHHLAKDRTEPYRACFKKFFNEDVPLAERLKEFSTETLKLFRELQPNPKHSHHHDERTMATLLTYHDPYTYALYKDSFYQKYCKLIGIKPKKVGEKYLHYLDLLNEFISEYVETDKELLQMVNDVLTEDAFDDRNHKLLAQDILYRMLEGENTEDASFQQDEATLKKLISKYTLENLNVYFDTLDKLIEALGIEDETKLAFSTSDKLSFQVGIRFCLNLERNQFYFIAPEDYAITGVEKGQFEGVTKPSFFHRASAAIVQEHYPAIKQAVQFELESNKYTDKKKYDNAAFRKAAFDKEYRSTLFDFQETEAMKGLYNTQTNGKLGIPLNQILYGPPGTGKTYNTINRALEILGIDTQGIERSKLKKIFEDKVSSGQIVFTTFHQSMSYEDFIEGIKPQEASDKEGNPIITYKVEPGIFRMICKAASVKEGVNSFDEVYDQFLEDLQTDDSLVFRTPTHKKPFKVSINSVKNCVAKAETNVGTPMVVTKNMLREYVLNGEILDWKPYTIGIGDYIKSNYKLSVGQTTQQDKPFVLIIDEINRGNVSQIFGELITLIEDDKRLGRKEQLEITLPYSKEKFGVPANLYIIGTMNTADRSVEALDTALRRRFSFVEMPPFYDLEELQREVEGYQLKDVLFKINCRIEKLLGKDNLIGHSYFLCVEDAKDLRIAFQNMIIPLLQEYFYGDFGKIGLVLGEGFFTDIEQADDDIFASFGNYDSSGLAEKEVYHLVELIGENRLTDEAFSHALHTLMK